MKIKSKDFRVKEGDEVNLKKWPTIVKPLYKSKEQYEELLKEHVAQLSLTLAVLGGVGERVFHTVPDMPRNFDTVPAWPGHERNLMAPYFATYRRDGVAEGQECFWIPGGGSRREFSRFCEVVGPEYDDGIQGE